MLMVYNHANALGFGVHDPHDTGLTAFGYEVIAEMDRVGMIKDCSHTGYRTARDVMDASTVPVTFSHSNPLALRDHPRNIPDELIKACAGTGGVVGLSGVGLFLNDANDVGTEAFLRHVDYVSDLVGPAHVGIGTDYCDFDPDGLVRALASNPAIWPQGYGYGPGIKFMKSPKDCSSGVIRKTPFAASSVKIFCAWPPPSGSKKAFLNICGERPPHVFAHSIEPLDSAIEHIVMCEDLAFIR
jgi:membrane dipeptidase